MLTQRPSLPQTVWESREVQIQVPKTVMEDVEITYQVPAMDTRTHTLQRAKTVMYAPNSPILVHCCAPPPSPVSPYVGGAVHAR